MQLKLTTDYAIRIIEYLCKHGRASSSELSTQLHISQNYIRKLVTKTNLADFIDSYAGTYGGFQIRKGIERITLKQILYAMEKEHYVNKCLESEEYCSNCVIFETVCPIRLCYQRIQDIIDTQFESMVFQAADLIAGKEEQTCR